MSVPHIVTKLDINYFFINNLKPTRIMNKKDYQKPTMKVVQLQHTGMLMTSGQVNATMNDTWTEEEI